LCADGLDVFHVHEENRILAFQRWIPGVGGDVVVVVSLNETSFRDGSYWLGFPSAGPWREVFNSDVYDGLVNPNPQGNDGGVVAVPEPLHGLPASAGLTLPANSILVFARN
jgi:1,4-alpha-glucan branching enzyme